MLANTGGEIVGFSLAVVVGLSIVSLIESLEGVLQILATILTIIIVGLVEGSAVDLAQWLVLRRFTPRVKAREWLLATVVGAIVAWGAGMAVGVTLGDYFAMTGDQPLLTLLGAVAIGLLAGALLSSCQYFVLRRVFDNAILWAPAHSLAWALGMVVAFSGMAAIPDSAPVGLAAALGGATGLAMGLCVASITGLALIRFASRKNLAAVDPI